MKRMGFSFNINDIKDDLSKEDINKSIQEIIAGFCKVIMNQWALEHKGLNEDERIIYNGISRRFKKAIKENASFIDLENAEANFLIKCKKECRILTNEVMDRTEDLINNIKKVNEHNIEKK